jgi:CheY-like chemotaxis protein
MPTTSTRRLHSSHCNPWSGGPQSLKSARLAQANGQEEQDSPTVTLHVDVILTDWEMPIMDGLTCTWEIRELERQGLLTAHVPIIVTAANARGEQVRMVLDAGVVSSYSNRPKISASRDILANGVARRTISSRSRSLLVTL